MELPSVWVREGVHEQAHEGTQLNSTKFTHDFKVLKLEVLKLLMILLYMYMYMYIYTINRNEEIYIFAFISC